MGWRERIEEEAEELRTLRDEVKVQVHLAKLEADERWEDLEKRWQHVEGRLGVLSEEGKEVAEDVGEALKGVFQELRQGYVKMKKLL